MLVPTTSSAIRQLLFGMNDSVIDVYTALINKYTDLSNAHGSAMFVLHNYGKIEQPWFCTHRTVRDAEHQKYHGKNAKAYNRLLLKVLNKYLVYLEKTYGKKRD